MRWGRLAGLATAAVIACTLLVAPGLASATGTEGCTPGYWKNHTDSWAASGYSPTQTVESVFDVPASLAPLGDATLHEALSFKGGTGKLGAAKSCCGRRWPGS